MATWTHRTLVPVVLGEALVSLVLSIVLASLGWQTGPAVATLVTLAVSNLVIVPWLTLPRAGIPPRAAAVAAILGYGVGISGGVVVVAIALVSGFGPVPTLGVAAALTLIAAAGIVLLTVVRPGSTRRITSILRNGGLRVWIRQRREVREGRGQLDRVRIERPVLWVPGEPPLVTVRIATYNRGTMVRDRAIASALSQTYPNIEVVVVGDRCDAATEAAVRSVRDSRVRFENLAERGAYPSDPDFRWMVAGTVPMNRALELAKGEWIAPLDDDDEFTPDHVEVLIEACRERNLDFAYGVAEMEVEPGVWQSVGSAPLRVGRIVHAAVLFHRELGFIRHDLEAWRLHEPADWNVWHRMRDVGAQDRIRRPRRDTPLPRATGSPAMSDGPISGRSAVIVVNYRTASLTESAVRSALGSGAAEVLVIDNASADDIGHRMAALGDPRVRVVSNDRNLGFGAAANRGASLTESEVVIFLNSDAVLGAGAVAALVDEVDMFEGRAIAGPLVLNPDETIQRSVGLLPRPDDLTVRALGLHVVAKAIARLPIVGRFLRSTSIGREYEAARQQRATEVTMISGACLAVDRGKFVQLGGFDDRYFMYFEDADLCRRARAAGWRIRFVPDAVVHHLVAGSTGRDYHFGPLHGPSMVVYLGRWYGRPGAALGLALLALRALASSVLLRPGSGFARSAWRLGVDAYRAGRSTSPTPMSVPSP